jgi:hypothetical protein
MKAASGAKSSILRGTAVLLLMGGVDVVSVDGTAPQYI